MGDLTFYTRRCKHQRTGAGASVCGAGVRYDDLLALHPGHRLPCYDTAAFRAPMAPCPHLVRYTEEEARAERAAMDAAVAKILVGRSPCCDAPLRTTEGARSRVQHCAKCGAFASRECFDAGGGHE